MFVIATFRLHSIFKEDKMYQNGMEWIRLLVLKTTFNNIPVLLVEESNVLKEYLRLATSHCQIASLNAVSSMPYHGWNLELGLWGLTPLSKIFQLYHGGQFY